jgi:hypothetical protein
MLYSRFSSTLLRTKKKSKKAKKKRRKGRFDHLTLSSSTALKAAPQTPEAHPGKIEVSCNANFTLSQRMKGREASGFGCAWCRWLARLCQQRGAAARHRRRVLQGSSKHHAVTHRGTRVVTRGCNKPVLHTGRSIPQGLDTVQARTTADTFCSGSPTRSTAVHFGAAAPCCLSCW